MADVRTLEKAQPRFRLVGSLQAPAGFDTPVAVSAGPEGPVALWCSAVDRDDLHRRYEVAGGASFAATRTRTLPRVALTSYTAASLSPRAVTVVDEFPVAHGMIQPLPDGEFLVAGARCTWDAGGPEQNALVVGADGEVLRAGTLGDGIEHLLVDDAGEVWTGYLDEGIFGNFGWGGPGRAPLGSAGVVRWSTRFEKVWEYQAVDGYTMADCYVLNVDGRRAWACPYTDFPIVEMAAEEVSLRPTTGVVGPRGLVVAGANIAVIGDYRDDGSLMLGSLDDLGALEKTHLAMPDGGRVPRGRLVCRGSVAHLFVGSAWLVFDLTEVL